MKFLFRQEWLDWLSWLFGRWQTKVAAGLIAFSIVVLVIFFTDYLVDGLIERERNLITAYSSIYQLLESDEITTQDISIESYFNLLLAIAPNISFPMVMTDEKDAPNYPYEQYSLNIYIDPQKSVQEQRKYMEKYVLQMQKDYEPIIIRTSDGKVLSKFYYTHSSFIDILRYFPIAATSAFVGFVFIGYLAFSNMKRSEESKVWVGMSKEAAHQLGTPLSSLLAWMEIMKYNSDNPSQIVETISEMEKDVHRLSIIATRFSKIGSKPDLAAVDMVSLIEKVGDYFEKRLPHLGRKVDLIIIADDRNIIVDVNIDLFSWVLENLIKNAAEAIDKKHGSITISIVKDSINTQILVTDSGKGMTNATKNSVFNPGFTTKARGWGLGLSLCKRIVEQYHDGKIYVKETNIGRGTTFAIELPLKA